MRLKKTRFKKVKTYFFPLEKKSKLYFLKNKTLYNLKKVTKKNFIILEKEIICEINTSIDILFKNKLQLKNIDVKTQKNCIPNITALTLFFKKNQNLNNFYKKKQYIYNILNLCFVLEENFNFLVLKEIFKQNININKQELKLFFLFKNFYQERFFNLISQQKLKNNFLIVNNKNTLNFYFFVFYFNFLNKKRIYFKFLETLFIKKEISSNFFWRKKFYFYSFLNKKLQKSNITYLFQTNNMNFISLKKNKTFLNFINFNYLKKNLNLSSYAWKESSRFNNMIFLKKKSFSSRTFLSRQLSNKFLFLLSKLYEKTKKVYFNKNIKLFFKHLKEFFIFEIFNSINKKKVKSLLFLKYLKMRTLRKPLFLYKKNKKFNYNLKNLKMTLRVIKNFNFNLKVKKNSVYLKDKKIFLKKKSLVEKKIVQKTNVTRTNQIDKIFSFFFSEITSVFFINALTLTKFSFFFPQKDKRANIFIKKVEKEMISKYKYVAVYIQDLVRISFLSLFLKKPKFLASFIGFQIEKLPKNRKETKFIRFIIKVIKIFSSQQKEMLSLKIEFKGRVNRWRRTKIIKGLSGVLSKFDYENRIEYGTGKAINRKGALGIRIWFYYEPIFEQRLKLLIYKYVKYSQHLHLHTIKKFFQKFKSI